jgi:hypothetical protein
MAGARISEVSLDRGIEPRAFIQPMREQQPNIGSHRGSTKVDTKLGVEPDATRAGRRVTHWMTPSAPARHQTIPHFSPALSDYGPAPSPLQNKNVRLKSG